MLGSFFLPLVLMPHQASVRKISPNLSLVSSTSWKFVSYQKTGKLLKLQSTRSEMRAHWAYDSQTSSTEKQTREHLTRRKSRTHSKIWRCAYVLTTRCANVHWKSSSAWDAGFWNGRWRNVTATSAGRPRSEWSLRSICDKLPGDRTGRSACLPWRCSKWHTVEKGEWIWMIYWEMLRNSVGIIITKIVFYLLFFLPSLYLSAFCQ